jgi:hypothetical protein
MIEHKKNYEKEDISSDKLDHWYGTNNFNIGIFRSIIIAIIIMISIYIIFNLL